VSRSYDAVLKGDHLAWKGSSPEAVEALDVKVVVPEEGELLTAEERRRRAAAALEKLAATGGIDVEAWLASRTVLTSAHCDFTGLTADERLELAERLLASVRPEERTWTLSTAQRAELDRRLAEHHRDPEEGESWEMVREEVEAELAARRPSAA
jgi:putative addiction module component (TIGR02574 family)